MTRKNAGAFASKWSKEEKPDPRIAEAVQASAAGGEFSCLQCEQLATELQVKIGKVGVTLDLLEIRIARCQLGLFGYAPESRIVKPAPAVSPDIERAIRHALVNDRLPCIAAWSIAKSFELPRMDVSAACEALKIKIKPCQVGAF
jgi:hypothetical protein